MQHLLPNTTLQGGKYRIERVLGQGGFGITYLAVQTSLNRYVAIKEFFMKDYCSRDETTRTMSAPSMSSSKLVEQYRNKFVKEAKNLARLHHQNIISVIEVFEENDTVYYVMPYYAGGSLYDLVSKYGALSESEAMKYVRQIANALKYMHEEQHICHYDVKPANILLDDKGNAVLIDFGISKNYDSAGHETTSTPIGLSDGYAPIEQYNQNVEDFSPASDVYALGATLYFLLHGKRPVSAVHRASGKPLLMSSNLSQGVKNIINASMKVSKTERAGSVDVFMKSGNSYGWLIIIALVIIGGVGIGIYLSNRQNSKQVGELQRSDTILPLDGLYECARFGLAIKYPLAMKFEETTNGDCSFTYQDIKYSISGEWNVFDHTPTTYAAEYYKNEPNKKIGNDYILIEGNEGGSNYCEKILFVDNNEGILVLRLEYPDEKEQMISSLKRYISDYYSDKESSTTKAEPKQKGSETFVVEGITGENQVKYKQTYVIDVNDGNVSWTFKDAKEKRKGTFKCNPLLDADIIIAECKSVIYWWEASHYFWFMAEEHESYRYEEFQLGKKALGLSAGYMGQARKSCPNAFEHVQDLYQDLVNYENGGELWDEIRTLSYALGEYPLEPCDLYDYTFYE